jgi:ribosome biogenesis GTPase
LASNKRSKKVRARITNMRENERRQLYKRAANLRRASKAAPSKPKHRPDYEDWSDEDAAPTVEKRKRRHNGSLRQWAEALVEDGDLGAGEIIPGPEPSERGMVLFATSGLCQVLLEGSDVVVECSVTPDIAASQRSDLAVGDHVEIVAETDPPTIVGVLPRSSVLSRPDSGPGGRFVERVVAANVDRVVVVAAARQPPLRARLLDRYLVAIEHGGADPAIAINKTDLLDDAEREELLEVLAPYRTLGVPLVVCSVEDRTGIDELAELLCGELAVLVGQSGVGKSSLLNALEPHLEIATRAPGRANKGRHTTTASTLHRLADGTRIIDTPGVREFGLWQLSTEELCIYFHEFDEPAADCRYRDCIHTHEPECGVRNAVERGKIPAGRYDSYRRLLTTLDHS